MPHSKTKFNNSWLKKKDSNGHLLEWWCKSHDSDKFKAVCKLCDKEIQVANNGCFALMQYAKQIIHKQKAVMQNISEEAKTSKQVVVVSTSTSEPKPSDVTEHEGDQRETIGGHEGSKQPLIKHFFMKTVRDTDKGQSSLLDKSKADHGEETMSLPDQICKAEAIWALKTAKDDFSFRASDGFPQLLQRMCPDSEIAKGVKMSCTKVSYVIGHGLGPYFLQKTVDDILNTPGTYFTLHFDETMTSQIKKQFDILVRYYSDNHNEVRVRFLKAAVFGHAYAESVANELREFSLPLKYLLSLSSDGPNVNKAIKTNINSKLKANYQKELVDTGPC